MKQTEHSEVAEVRLTGRPSAPNAEALHQRLLEAALRCFTTSGFHRTSIAAIAAAANIHKRTINRRYATKEQLFAEVWMWNYEPFRKSHRALPPPGEELPYLRALLRELLDFSLQPSVLGLLKVLISESDRFRDIIDLIFTGKRTRLGVLIHDLVERAAASGQLSVSDPWDVAQRLGPGIFADAWLMHMIGIEILATAEQRDSHFEARWNSFLTQYGHDGNLDAGGATGDLPGAATDSPARALHLRFPGAAGKPEAK